MQQQPPRTHGVFIVDIAFFIRADVHLTDPYLAVLDGAPRIFEVQRALTERLDLRAEQLNSGLEAFFYKVFVKGFVVLCQNFNTLIQRKSPSFYQFYPIFAVSNRSGSSSCGEFR